MAMNKRENEDLKKELQEEGFWVEIINKILNNPTLKDYYYQLKNQNAKNIFENMLDKIKEGERKEKMSRNFSSFPYKSFEKSFKFLSININDKAFQEKLKEIIDRIEYNPLPNGIEKTTLDKDIKDIVSSDSFKHLKKADSFEYLEKNVPDFARFLFEQDSESFWPDTDATIYYPFEWKGEKLVLIYEILEKHQIGLIALKQLRKKPKKNK